MADLVPPLAEQLSAHRNRLGFRGVSEDKFGRFRASLGKKKHHRSSYYSTAEEAAKAYDRMARQFYGDRAYLNFPEHDERKVQAVLEGFCKRGHQTNSRNTYVSSAGRHHCRVCNALAQARRKTRIRFHNEASNEAPTGVQNGDHGLLWRPAEVAEVLVPQRFLGGARRNGALF